MQKSARAGSIDHKTGGDADFGKFDPVVPLFGLCQPDLIEIFNADFLRFAHKVRIDMCPMPMSIGNRIVRTCRDQQLIFARKARCPLAETVVKESEAAFEPAVEIRISLPPRSPFCERENARKIVPKRQIFQQQVGKRCRGFADREAGMPGFLQQNHRPALAAENHRQQGARKSGTDYGDIVIGAQCPAPQTPQSTGAGTSWRRFISRRRS